MASKQIRGITIEIGGDTTKLGKALEEGEKQSRSLQGELKQVERLLKFDPGNTELLAQKQKILTEAVKETTDKLEILRKAEEQVVEQFNRGDIGEDQLRAFQREIIKTQSELDGFEAKLNGFEEVIKDVGDAAEESSGGFTIMKGALADLTANAISGAISKLGDFIGSLMELSEATEEYRTMQAKLEGSADTFGYSIDFANGKYQEFYKYLGDDQMATNAITNLMGLGTSTENISSLAEAAVGVWSAYGDSIPIEGLTEAMNETAQVGKVTGSLADALNWAGISEDKFNEKLEKCKTTQERADLIAKTLNDTYGESKKKYDELNGSVTEANEAELALKETQAELGETMAPVNTAITNLKNQALEALAPLVEKCANAFLDLLNWLKEHPTAMKVLTAVAIALATAFTILAGALAIQGLITGVTKAIAFLNTTLLANPIVLIVAAITALVAAFIYLWNNCEGFRNFWLNLWENVKTFFINAWNSIKTFCTETIPQIVDNVVNWFKQLPSKIWTWLLNTIERVKTWAFNMRTTAVNAARTMIANVVSFFNSLPEKIGYALGFVIGKLILFGKNAISWVKTNVPLIISNIVNFFKQLPGKIWTFLSNVISRVGTWGSNLLSKAKSTGSNFLNAVVNFFRQLPSKLWTWLSNTVSRVATWGSNLASKGKQAAKQLLDSVVNTAKQIPSKMLSIGKDIVSGVWKGIKGAASTFTKNVKSFFSGIVKGAKDALGINSPSKVFAEVVGKAIPEGIAKGVVDNAIIADDSVKNMTDDLSKQEVNLNGATINRKLNATFAAEDIGKTINITALADKLDGIYERLNRMQIVLDTGTLVGETIDKIDAGLASRQLLSARGV